MSEKSPLFEKLFHGLFVMAFCLIVALGFAVTLPKCRQLAGLKQERQRLHERIAARNAEIAAVREKQNRFRSDREFVESLARENRRVFPGELVFLFDR